MAKKIRVLVKEPGKMLEERMIEPGLQAMRDIVGGPIELLRIHDDVDMWINEEGKFDEECKPNFVFGDDVIMGTVFFAGHRAGETISVPNTLDVTALALRLQEMTFRVEAAWNRQKGYWR